MIPEAYIRAWYEQAPWQAWSMVEQDLILSRTLVDLFHSRLLADSLILRGGTVLHKLFFPRALRYSEDIDLVQRAAGPIGPVFDEIRGVLRDWLGEPKRKIGPDVATLTYRVASEDVPPFPLRIKVEINTGSTSRCGRSNNEPLRSSLAGSRDARMFPCTRLMNFSPRNCAHSISDERDETCLTWPPP